MTSCGAVPSVPPCKATNRCTPSTSASSDKAPGGASSRYEIVQVLAPAADVAIAHVRRVALDDDGRPVEPSSDVTDAFSEMALYVLIRRNRMWWLAAGQNTIVRPPPG